MTNSVPLKNINHKNTIDNNGQCMSVRLEMRERTVYCDGGCGTYVMPCCVGSVSYSLIVYV